MFKNVIMWILQNIFKIPTQTTQKEVEDNQKYAVEYERIDDINFNSIFSNKLANYVINDSNVNLIGENARVELLNNTTQSMWKKAKKIIAMGFRLWWSNISTVCKRWENILFKSSTKQINNRYDRRR